METDPATVTILLIDDSEDDRLLFMSAFRRSRLTGNVVEKEDGDGAIGYLSQLAPDAPSEWPTVTFLDLKMPGRNGFDVLEWLRQQPMLKALRIVVLSGSQEPGDLSRARELGAAEYVVKPISADKLRELVVAKGSTQSSVGRDSVEP